MKAQDAALPRGGASGTFFGVRLPFEFFLALRFLRPRRSYVSIITMLSLFGVLAGVMVLIVVLSVMEGFEKELREKLMGFNAHLTVGNSAVMFPDVRTDEILKGDPDIVGYSPFVMGQVLVEFQNKIAAPQIRGVDVDSIDAVLPLKETVRVGEWNLGPDTVIVGLEWAKRFGAGVGDKVYVYAPRNFERLREQQTKGAKIDQSYFLPSEYVIAGIFSSGYFEFDYNFFLLSLPEAQKLYDLKNGYHGISIKTRDPLKVEAIKNRLNQKLESPNAAISWMDQNRRLVEAVAVERRVMSFLLFFVMVVAAFGLMSTLITVTVQKTKEIGLLKALGARDRQIMAIFTLYGFIVGVLGAAAGVAAGLSLLEWRNEFSAFLGRSLGIEIFPAEIYNLAQIPAVLDYQSVALIAASGIVLSTLAAFIPAWIAARIDAAQSLHAE